MSSSSPSSPERTAAQSAEPQEPSFSYKHATHDEVLEDLSSRFILNLPDEELSSLERICFQVEQAHWFYEDFVREQNPNFPSLPLKKFSAMLFHACPLLHQWSHDHEQAFNTFMQYKTRVPVCGAIMLNDTWEKCLLVKGWKSSSGWGFPKGKINEDEPPPTCAIREVLEETGYNLAGEINPDDVIEMSIREQKISLFIVPGVPEDFPFKTKTRKEISKIEWFKLTDLPTWKRSKASAGKFYLISPFISALKTFINERKPAGIRKKVKASSACHSPNESAQESSSQSSSADNGDPQTPSPQYSAPAINSGPHLTDLKSDLSTETMDPHFARLLSSLTLSAATSAKEDDLNAKAPVITSPTTEAKSPSARHRRFLRSHSARKPSLDVQPMPPLTENSHSPIDKAINNQSPQSPRATSKRMSISADLSPYLSRPVEPPTSARQMKQIALLESVADESAKLASTLSHRDPMLPAAPDLPISSFSPSHHPRVLNSSSVSLQHRSPLMRPGSTSAMLPTGGLPARSRTSHAFYRGTSSMMQPNFNNIDQSHLLDILRSTPGAFSSTQPPSRIHAAPSISPKQVYSLPQTQFLTAQLTRPKTPIPSTIPAPSPTTNSLLSILNTKSGLPTSPSSYLYGRH